MVYYANPTLVGTNFVQSFGDGYTVAVKWYQATPTTKTNKIAYHIYYSTEKEEVFSDGIKYVSIDASLEANLINLDPGQEYFFAVRPVEYSPTINLALLPIAYDNLRYYPSSLLRSNISKTDLTIPLVDVEDFPATGVVKAGYELMNYSSIDFLNNDLILASLSDRGYNGTEIRIHNVDGYDGYSIKDPLITLFSLGESNLFDRIYECQSRFEYYNHPYTIADGYKQVTKDLLNTDYTSSDVTNITYPMYDYAGYHRTDPVQLLNGTCVGSYIGGEMGCIDGYGNLQFLRGMSVQDHNNQRQEMLLTVTGRPAVLIKRRATGIVCSCYLASSEYPDDRCPKCGGGKFILSYEQYYNPRRSDGRIMIRIGPTDENVKMYEQGLESEFDLDIWTQASPTIHNRDILILFDQDNNEEFRYEVMTVTRNNTLGELMGGQKMKAKRIRKTDPAYQIRTFRDTSMFPSKLNTSINSSTGIPLHSHEIVISENITNINQINQTTSVKQGHNHAVISGILQVSVGHSHTIVLI